jgi:hypothetical protein
MLDKLITYIVCWYNTVYQVLPVVWTNHITTRRSDTGSHNRLDLIQSLVPPHYVCNGYLFWWISLFLELTLSLDFMTYSINGSWDASLTDSFCESLFVKCSFSKGSHHYLTISLRLGTSCSFSKGSHHYLTISLHLGTSCSFSKGSHHYLTISLHLGTSCSFSKGSHHYLTISLHLGTSCSFSKGSHHYLTISLHLGTSCSSKGIFHERV